MRAAFVLALVPLILAGCSGNPGADIHIQDIHGMALDPQVPTRLYVATHHGLFMGENDTRWSAVTKEPFDMMGFTAHPSDSNVMYASGHPSRLGQGWAVGVVKSTDAGRTWATLALKNEVDFHAMAMEAGTAGALDTIYGFHAGKVHFSRDGGTTWTSKPVSFQVAALAFDAAAGKILAATSTGLQRTGRNLEGAWEVVKPDPAVAVASAPDGVLAYFESGGLSKSVDGGRTWSLMNWTVPSDDYPWGIAPGRLGSGVTYAGTARGSIFKTVDGGATWTKIR